MVKNIVAYNRIGVDYDFLHRGVKLVEDAHHLELTKWSVTFELKGVNPSDYFSILVINLGGLKEAAERITA